MRSLTSLPGQNSGSISISSGRNERGLNSAQSDNVSAACSRAFRLYATQCRCPSTLGSDGWSHPRVLRPRNFEPGRDHHHTTPSSNPWIDRCSRNYVVAGYRFLFNGYSSITMYISEEPKELTILLSCPTSCSTGCTRFLRPLNSNFCPIFFHSQQQKYWFSIRLNTYLFLRVYQSHAQLARIRGILRCETGNDGSCKEN